MKPSSHSALKGLRVLVVDDQVDSCELTQFILEDYGIEVKAALTVQQAVEIFVRFQPDILVSDLMMPYEDGYSLMHQIRRLEVEQAKTKTLAVVITAEARREAHERALLAGFHSVLVKPVDFTELIEVIANLVKPQEQASEPIEKHNLAALS